jgi:hypothetical protein
LAYLLYWAYCIPRDDLEKDYLDKSIEEAVSLARRVGDPYLLALTIHGMADRIQWRTNDATQIPYLLESLKLAREIDDYVLMSYNMRELALYHVILGEYRESGKYYRELIQRSMRYRNFRRTAYCTQMVGRLAVKKGHVGRGIRLIAASVALRASDPEILEELGLDEASIVADWNRGVEFSLEEAVDLAIEELDS